jgi:hypothetical protein
MLTGGTTAVAIERALSQYCDIPFHADEFRQDEVDKNRTSTLRSAFGRQSKAKGIMDGSNKTRSAQPMTSPIVSGEGVTSDSATLSRYVEAILAADKRLGSQDEQRQRFDDIQLRLPQLHRITRYILLNRKKFAKTCMQNLDEWMRTDEVMKSIHVDRLRISYGTAWAVFHTMMEYFSQTLATARAEGTFEKLSISPPDIAILSSATSDFKTFAINYAKNAAVDVISINFVVKFWSEVVTYSNLSHSAVKHHIWFEWCKIDPETNKAVRTTAVRDTEGLVRCIILQPKELYAEYEKEKRSRGQEPELKLGNIRAELQNERYWLKAPTNQKRQAHRMSFGEKGQIDVWILRFDCMQPAVQAVFAEKFEMKDEEDEDDLPLGI